jgi:hypothetical protein
MARVIAELFPDSTSQPEPNSISEPESISEIEEIAMFYSKMTCAALLLVLAQGTVGSADETKVVITVNRPSTEVEVVGSPPFEGQRAAVDVAILLDTSNSMDGLIKQAKSQLWTIVQQFAKAKKNGQTPILRVALFEYGNTRLPASEGYIRQVVPLTDDLDKLSEALFGLTTSGGDEYCGQVIDEAITRLDWSKKPGGYKAIFIAGNEPFTQGGIDYRSSCKRAIEQGVVVNTIHCGANNAGVSGKWQHGAELAEGEFFNIDQDKVVVQIPCPQDKIIIKLNTQLNKTYLWYGDRDVRLGYRLNQSAQDMNAEAAGSEVAASRASVKGGKSYSNLQRDLIDTMEADEDILKKVKKEHLPDELQGLSLADRKAYVKKFSKQRAEIRAKIGKLAAERETYLAKERKRLAKDSGEATLGDVVVLAVRKQLAKSGFETAKSNE